MDIINENMDKKIYTICSLISNLSKLDVEFLDNSHHASIQLFHSQMPFILAPSRNKATIFIDNLLREKAPDDCLYHIDNFMLSYLGVGVWENKSYIGTITVGPFLYDIPDDILISRVIESNKLPIAHRQQLQQYYHALSILDSKTYKNICSLIVNLTINPFFQAKLAFTESKDFIINNQEENELENEKFYSEVEFRYKIEKEIQNAVEKGSWEEASKLIDIFEFNPAHRVPNNPLRARKNLAFVYNTLLRLGAERGGVSPIYIHNMSDKFAILIEKVSSMADLEKLLRQMAFEYCDLVKKLSTAGYSPVTGKAINYINLNFYHELSIEEMAQKIKVSPAHLSRQFKKEMGLTVTEFINKRRIEEAKFLIRQNKYSITEISLMVGFINHNYFSSVFKQITSMTPKEYLIRNRKKE